MYLIYSYIQLLFLVICMLYVSLDSRSFTYINVDSDKFALLYQLVAVLL